MDQATSIHGPRMARRVIFPLALSALGVYPYGIEIAQQAGLELHGLTSASLAQRPELILGQS